MNKLVRQMVTLFKKEPQDSAFDEDLFRFDEDDDEIYAVDEEENENLKMVEPDDYANRTPVGGKTQGSAQKLLVSKGARISMLGTSGSGKTAFLSGVYQNYVLTAENGFGLQLDSKKNEKGYYASIKNTAIYDGETLKTTFPIGTTNSSIYHMIMTYQNNMLCEFDFIDYKGGLLRDMANPENEDSDVVFVREHIADSDVIFMFIDAVKLSYYQSKQDRGLYCYCDKMSEIYVDLVRTYNRKYHVVVLLSKIDDITIDKADKENYYEGLVKKAGEVMETVKNHAESFLILPVSAVGDGRTNTKMTITDGKPEWKTDLVPGMIPEPKNIDISLLYACRIILKKRKQELRNEKEPLEKLFLEKRKKKDNDETQIKLERLKNASAMIMELENNIEKIEEAKYNDWVPYILDRKGNS